MTRLNKYVQTNREDYGINWTISGFITPDGKCSALMLIKNDIEPHELLPERLASDLRTIAQIIEEESWERGQNVKE